MRLTRVAIAALALLGSLSATGWAQTRVTPGLNLFSPSQDVEIGRQSAAQVDKQLPMLNTPAVNRLVSRVGARLAAQAPGPKFTYRFKVVNVSDLNAFALPGGYIYVNRGLVEQVRTEGQLAGVMAHEIAHVALRHPTSQLTKAYAAQAGFGLLETLLGNHSGTRQAVNAVGGFGLNTLFLRFSRTAESQADIEGAQIMARAGYDPAEMADFFQVMRQQQGRDPGKVAQFFSDHPAPAQRETRVRNEARLLGYTHHTAPVGGLAAAQSELRTLPKAPAMSQVALLHASQSELARR